MSWDRLHQALVTGFGVGHLPIAPGTWGSLLALALALVVHWLVPGQERVVLGAGALLLTYPAIAFSTRYCRLKRVSDPGEIVVDEILGQTLCLLWAPISAGSLALGFVLFRFFDIVKPFPARSSERLPGGVGIVCDDLVAGLYAGLVLKVLMGLLN